MFRRYLPPRNYCWEMPTERPKLGSDNASSFPSAVKLVLGVPKGIEEIGERSLAPLAVRQTKPTARLVENQRTQAYNFKTI